MTCVNARLEEYLDGELAAADRAATEGHLTSCADCRAELERLRKLEEILRRVPAGAPPDAERFLAGVRARSRRPAIAWRYAVAAAVILAVSVLFLDSAPRGPQDVAAYLKSPSPELERRIRKAGPALLPVVEGYLADPDVKTQFAAASLLFRLLDPAKPEDAATLARVSARFQAPAREGWILADLGAEEEDVETVPIAISALETGEAWGIDALRHLNRMHKQAQQKVVGAVVTLLKSDNPAIQKRALEIVKELDIEFPLTAVVDLLDSPDLGGEALRILRRATGKDYGRDQRAWRKALTP